MKRFLALAALVLGLASCQTEPEGLDVNVGGEVDTFVTVAIPDVDTRANSAESGIKNLVIAADSEINYTIRYIFEVYYGDNGVQKQVYYTDGQSASFPVRLVPGRDYNFVAWADIVEQPADEKMNKALPYDGNTTDVHYDTTNLKAITLLDEWNAMDETRDAYTGFHNTADPENEKYTGSSSINIQMTRPFAKLRVITTDMVELNNLGIRPVSANVRYSSFSHESFNALNGTYSDETIEKTHTYAIADYADQTGANKVLFTDYFFADDNDVVKFQLDVFEKGVTEQNETTRIKLNDFNTDIPVKRNYLTTISGNILTDGNKITVDVTEGFANANNSTNAPYYQETISSVAELLKAIDSNSGEYILISDLDVNSITASTQAATRTAGVGATINLNGYTITLKTNLTIAEGKTLTINDINENGENGAIVSEGGQLVNNGTLNIEGGYFGADTIENNNGVVNITGGTFESNPSDFVDDDYAVVKNNGEFTLVQKEEAIEINGTKYRSIKKAVAAAQNGETVKFILDVEQADGVVITDKNITIDLGGNRFTITEGANTNNRNFKVNGSSVVTIKNGTMVAEGELTSGAYGTVRTEDTAVVNLESVKLFSYRGYGLNVKACTGTTIKIKDSEIYAQYSGGVEAAGGNIELTNVKIDQTGVYSGAAWCSVAIGVNGGGNVTVNSGNYSASAISTDANAAQGTWVAYVMSSGGTLNIKDGTFKGVVAETAAAANACGLICADRAAVVEIHGGTFNSNGAILDMRNNVGTQPNPKATLFGGTFSADPRVSGLYSSNLITVAEGYIVEEKDGVYTVIKPVAKVGATSYEAIDDAIAAWTNNTTLTLMSDVTLPDVVTLKSTEHHILNLSTFTMTAASGKNAIEITPYGDGAGTAAKSCLTINANATNPGSINAGSKACIYYKKTNGMNDRIMVTINGGVFDGTISSSSNNGGQACPYFVFNGGVFNKSINLTKAMLKVTGGTFHGMFSCTGDSTAHRLISGGTFKTWTFMTADAANKFCVGTDKQTYNVGVYVNDEGYLVVGGPVITEFGDKFAAKATNATKWSSYLQYSSAATNGLYYTNADMAISKHGEANVELK